MELDMLPQILLPGSRVITLVTHEDLGRSVGLLVVVGHDPPRGRLELTVIALDRNVTLVVGYNGVLLKATLAGRGVVTVRAVEALLGLQESSESFLNGLQVREEVLVHPLDVLLYV